MHSAMHQVSSNARIHRRLIDTLYVESMLLADEARGYFDEVGRVDRDQLDPLARVSFSCESLKVTTRLMHVIAWILTQRAVEEGELRARDALDPARRLGPAPITEGPAMAALPLPAQSLILASIELFRRVALLDGSQEAPARSPVRSLHARLEAAF